MDRSTDPLNTARGVFIAILVSLPLFGIVGAAGYNCYGKLVKAGLMGQENFVSFRTANGGGR